MSLNALTLDFCTFLIKHIFQEINTVRNLFFGFYIDCKKPDEDILQLDLIQGAIVMV